MAKDFCPLISKVSVFAMTAPKATSRSLLSRLKSLPFVAELSPNHLSGRLLVLTVLFVMLAEVLIYVPSIANFRATWLRSELEDAQIASLALEVTQAPTIPAEVERELLQNAGVLQVALRRHSTRILMLSTPDVPMSNATYDLRAAMPWHLVYDAFVTLFVEGDRILIIRGTPYEDAGELIEIMLDERLLKTAMLDYSRNILLLSLAISALTALLVFLAMNSRFVAPMKRLTENMVWFRQNPEDAGRIIQPSSKIVELGIAERELSDLQTQVRSALHQQRRLAELGTAVSKINHDLRNILSSAQLISDMMRRSDDPKVQKLAPKLISSVDRAIDLATRTLRHGKAEEAAPEPTEVAVDDIASDVISHLTLAGADDVDWHVATDGVYVWVDREHLFRIFMNLLRNAAQALNEMPDSAAKRVHLSVVAADADTVSIAIKDTGPGIPQEVQDRLFEAFAAGSRAGSVGLGLAIARELVVLNNGALKLATSGADGTHFHLTLPASRR